MKNRLLHNEYEAYTEEGLKLSTEAYDVLNPLFKKLVKKGYRVKDVELLILDNLVSIAAIETLTKSMAMQEEKRKNEPA